MLKLSHELSKLQKLCWVQVSFIFNVFIQIFMCFLLLNKHLAQDTACLGLVHGDDPERRYGEGGGWEVHIWEHMYTRGGFMSMYGKTNTVL